MQLIWIGVPISLAFVIGIVVASILWRRSNSDAGQSRQIGSFPVVRIPTLLNEYEHSLYKYLQQAVGQNAYLLPKVSVIAIVGVDKKVERQEFYRRLLGSKVVDYLLCDEQKSTPVLAILISTSKNQDDLQMNTDILKSAGIPVLALPYKQSFAPSELDALIRKAMNDQVKSENMALLERE